MSKFEFSPVPQATDFDVAFTQVDAAIHREGGPSVVMGGESSFSIADQRAFEQDLVGIGQRQPMNKGKTIAIKFSRISPTPLTD